MLVLLIIGLKCTLAAVTVSMTTGQTDRWTDARPLRYAFC